MANITKTTTNSQNLIISKEDIDFIKKQMFPVGASVKDIDFCLKVSQQLGLNPITKEIFFVERKSQVNGQWVSKVEPLVSRDGLLSMAHKSGKFGGIEVVSQIKETPKLVNGIWENKKDLVAKAIVYRTDTQKPFISEVAYSEYVQKTKELRNALELQIEPKAEAQSYCGVCPFNSDCPLRLQGCSQISEALEGEAQEIVTLNETTKVLNEKLDSLKKSFVEKLNGLEIKKFSINNKIISLAGGTTSTQLDTNAWKQANPEGFENVLKDFSKTVTRAKYLLIK